jgi:CrcB protein
MLRRRPLRKDGVMIMYLAVAIGGALGTMGRYFVSGLIANTFGETFPWGTLIINITGSFVMASSPPSPAPMAA